VIGAPVLVPLAAVLVVIVTMLGELVRSRRNEGRLIDRGALAPPDPVYSTMRWMYPAVFVLMAVEGMLRGAGIDWWLLDGSGPGWWTWLGLAIFTAGKAVKYWAIATLGDRWTYRVLVLPGVPLVARGPYRYLRHPNYVGVVGELIGMMLLTSAWVGGPMGTIAFGELLRQRIEAENRALASAPG
jgi:methyltransferase